MTSLFESFGAVAWLDILIGAFIPVVLGMLKISYTYLFTHRSSFQKKLCGKYFVYRYSPMDKFTIRMDDLIIFRKFFGGLSFKYFQVGHDDETIKGYVKFGSGGIVYLIGSDKKYGEVAYIAFKSNFDPKVGKIFAIYSGIDLNYYPFSLQAIVSNQKIPKNQAKRILGDREIMRLKVEANE